MADLGTTVDTTSLQTQHPQFALQLPDWQVMRDVKAGERQVKGRTSTYLPPTKGMVEDGYGTQDAQAKGNTDYKAYITRASFSNYTKRAVITYLGLLWHKEPDIEVPKSMEPLLENATRQHDTIMQLLRNMHEELLTTGRLGLLADMPEGQTTTAIPYISMYKAEKILNWDEGEDYQVSSDSLNLVVLDESGERRRGVFSWYINREFRVLMLGDPTANEESNSGKLYTQGLFVDNEGWEMTGMKPPNYHGLTLQEIPFVFVNAMDLEPTPKEPPQLELAKKDLTIYRGEADYRQALSQQAQPTLVISGGGTDTTGKPIRIGAGAVIEIPNPQGHAEFIGPDAVGIPEMRAALENDRREAEILCGQLTDNKSQQKESGDAMQTRMEGQTASLYSISTSAALGLQTVLRKIAKWMGEDPESVTVTANREFSASPLNAADFLALQNAKNAGLPIAEETIHDNLRKAGLTDQTYEEETSALDSEEPRLPLVNAQAGIAADQADQGQKLGDKAAVTQHKLGQQAADAQNKRDIVKAKATAALKPKPSAPAKGKK